MSKEEKNKSNKKNTTNKNNKKENPNNKKVEKNVTNTKNTKATKKEENKKQEKIRVIDTIYDEYNEDLEEEIVEEIIETKNPKKEKKEKSDKIEKIEKKAKKSKDKNNNNEKTKKLLLSLDKNRFVIYAFITGVLLTTLVAFIIWPDRIAALKNGEEPVVKVGKNTYTANELYDQMKDYYSVSLLLDKIDTDLLTKIFPETDDMKEEVKAKAENYFSMYEQYYGYTQEEFLKQNGFSSYDAFIEYLTLDHRRNLYLDDYIEKNTTKEEIQKYYDDNVFGDINTQHILIEVATENSEDTEKKDSKLNDKDAKKLAEEIITKLNDGTSWKDIQKEYKDKITFEDLSYQSWNASLEESFMTALKEMEDNTYSEEPVKTSYGYHIIHRIDQKEKPSLKKSKEKIMENIATEKKEKDSNLLYKSLISLREEKNIKFSDTLMKEKYEDYCKQYKK